MKFAQPNHPEWVRQEAAAYVRQSRNHRIGVALACASAAVGITLTLAAFMPRTAPDAAPPPEHAAQILTVEQVRIEQLCAAAQRANPDQLSCDFGGIEDARAWENQFREKAQ